MRSLSTRCAFLSLALWLVVLPEGRADGLSPAVGDHSPSQGESDSVKATPLVVGESFVLDSRVLGEKRRINIYLPPAVTAGKALGIPVLYMLDGGIDEDFVHVAGLVQVCVGNKTMKPHLLVGIENTERRRDLTGPTSDPEDKKIAPRVGGSAAFRNLLKSELMPEISRRYGTTREAAIVGESLAGLFVVETFLLEPELFDTYFAFDASLWWNRESLLAQAPELLKAKDRKGKALYLVSSSQPDLAKASQKLAGILSEAKTPGLRHEWVAMPSETHSTVFHPAALRGFRAWLAPTQPPK